MYKIIFNMPCYNRLSTSYYLHKLIWIGVYFRINYILLFLIKEVCIIGVSSYLSMLLSETITDYSRRYPSRTIITNYICKS